jgi:hypothetical protein
MATQPNPAGCAVNAPDKFFTTAERDGNNACHRIACDPSATACFSSKDPTMQTLIAAFDDHPTALHAVDQLIHCGFDPAEVHLQAASEPVPLMASEKATQKASEQRMGAADYESGFSSRVGHFFGDLFGGAGDDDHAGARSQDIARTPAADARGALSAYAVGLRRGSSVVVVHTAIDSDFDHVERLMYEVGAVDVVKSAVEWKRPGADGFDAGSVAHWSAGTMRPQRIDAAMEDADQLQAGNRGPGPGGVSALHSQAHGGR